MHIQSGMDYLRRRMALSGVALAISFLLTSCGGGGGGDNDNSLSASASGCVAPDRPNAATGVGFKSVVDDPVAFPTKLLQEPVQPRRWFQLERDGRIHTYEKTVGAKPRLWVDIRDWVRAEGNGGLVSMAFHPDYPATPEVFVWYSDGPDEAFVMYLDRLTVDNVENPSSFTLETILSVNQETTIHQGGDIVFDEDGYLYLSVGDSGVDAAIYAQDKTRLLGKVLRIDVTGTAEPYGIPPGNTFAGNGLCGAGANADNCPELYAWGLRNPFRMSFDGMGRLWVADVGANLWEEVNIVEQDGNYGWPCKEGPNDYETDACPISEALVEPVFTLDHNAGDESITGGYVYTSDDIPKLQGKYIFGDWVSGRVWALGEVEPGVFEAEEILNTAFRMTSFGLNASGDVFFNDFFSGDIYKLIPSDAEDQNTIPRRLSNTGCVDKDNPTQFEDSVTPYAITLPFWSDGAKKDRYFALPDGERIRIKEKSGAWEFPIGSVLIKEFRLDDELFETRLLMRHTDGDWAGYTYAWNEDGSDAIRVVGGRETTVAGQEWLYPSEDQCMFCHLAGEGFTLGPETAQFDRNITPQSTGKTVNQIDSLRKRNVFKDEPQPSFDLVRPTDVSASVEERARSWLHVNCSYCHQLGGVTQTNIELDYDKSLRRMKVCDTDPTQGDLGIAGAKLLVPRDPDNSILWQRLRMRGDGQMPPIGSYLADEEGVQVVAEWIESLSSCN